MDRNRFSRSSIINTSDSTLNVRRFWIWVNGSPVRVSVKPGQMLKVYESAPHEEGYSRMETFYSINVCRRTVEMVINTNSSDCDGRHSSTHQMECRWMDLSARDPREEDKHWIPRMPLWKDVGGSQYDQYAEEAGY